ncbi:MAG TPA: hypothetical protein PKV80_29305 [Leptospiraceae bacterium]|nr:hypothetical protein [Leptospiraceae bacterium]
MAIEKDCHEMANELAERIEHSKRTVKGLSEVLDRTEIEIPDDLFKALPPQ